jgi:hypothetical protein
MPTVILRGSKNGPRVARLVLEGSSSNPVRQGILNGEPFEVTDEEFAKLDAKYVLEPADGEPSTTEETPPEPEQGGDGTNNQDDET